MNRLFTFLTVLVLLYITNVQAQTFTRTAEIKDPSALERGFGCIVAGVDFDGDGLPEIYACNTNMVDGNYELIPRLYKFEWNISTSTWDSVWGVQAPVELQNTWPALVSGDLDKDGKPELFWGPVNNIGTDLNPARVLVYEYPGDGTDNMGVSDGFGGFEPNAKTSITTTPSFNLRPVKFVIADPDADNTDELIFVDRAATWHVGVLSVDDIPDNGGGLETWTVEFSGAGNADLTGTPYDVLVVGNEIGIFNSNGTIAKIKYEAGNWVTSPIQNGVMANNSSFKGSVVVDLGDGSSAVYVGSWLSGKVYLVDKPDLVDTLISYEIANFAPYAVRLNGSGAGDLDNDGHPDMVFGSRYMVGNTAKVPIFRLEYQGGDKTNPASYTTSIIDSAYWDKNGDMDVVCVANIDGDAADEVLYTQGYSRGNANDDPMPIIVLDEQFTPVSVELESDQVPDQFFLDQNYPNPFNPSTQIKFGITEASNVDLRVYDVLGREVAVLISNKFMGTGSYNFKFDAKDLSSGVYIYKITAGSNTVSKKMQLLK
jgi:hypothetical protein